MRDKLSSHFLLLSNFLAFGVNIYHLKVQIIRQHEGPKNFSFVLFFENLEEFQSTLIIVIIFQVIAKLFFCYYKADTSCCAASQG